jgi:peptidoglycan hydrolase-like amidase
MFAALLTAALLTADLVPAVLTPAVSPGAHVRAAPSPPVVAVTVAGHGLGHGRGMGQYGAYGYASETAYHWTYQQIVAHYYGSAHLDRLGAGADQAGINVDLSELNTSSTTPVRAARPGAAIRVNGGRLRTGTITLHHNGRVQTITATGGDVSVELPGVGWRTYDGVIQVQPSSASDGTGGQTWDLVPIERYVAGVVPQEAPSGWGATGGEAALEAQAVAVRSYALAYVGAVGRICDTDACQVYEGAPSTIGLGSFAAYSDAATSSTAGQVMCLEAVPICPAGDVAATEYSASTGGYTAGGTFPAVVDAGDAVAANPFHDWTTTVSVAAVEALDPAIGPVTRLHVTVRNGLGAMGGRALEVRITGTGGRAVTVSGSDFASSLGLPSDWFRFVSQP